ncbi:hypothetical protein KAW50_01375 [candidate division WOR-3 bacterium]|nr:hypothetical protein [candidate division WOR-3 bacterium]
MLFMTSFDIIPGKAEDIFYLIKKTQPPESIKVHQFLKLFGKPDFVVIYEAPNENAAMEFVLKFTSCVTPRTSLCTFMEGYEPKEE